MCRSGYLNVGFGASRRHAVQGMGKLARIPVLTSARERLIALQRKGPLAFLQAR